MKKLTNEYLRKLSKADFQELIKTLVRKSFGDKIENQTRIWAYNGFWFIYLPKTRKTKEVADIWNGQAFRRYSLKALAEHLKGNI